MAEIKHGTTTAYSKQGCRCDACRAHQAARNKKYRDAKKEKTQEEARRKAERANNRRKKVNSHSDRESVQAFDNFLNSVNRKTIEAERFNKPKPSERPGSRLDLLNQKRHAVVAEEYWQWRSEREAKWRLYVAMRESAVYDKKVDKRSD